MPTLGHGKSVPALVASHQSPPGQPELCTISLMYTVQHIASYSLCTVLLIHACTIVPAVNAYPYFHTLATMQRHAGEFFWGSSSHNSSFTEYEPVWYADPDSSHRALHRQIEDAHSPEDLIQVCCFHGGVMLQI